MRDVYQSWADHHSGGQAIPSGPGWEPAVVKTIELYRGASTVHTFPTVDKLRAVLGERFEEVGFSIPSYALGERCATLVLRPRHD